LKTVIITAKGSNSGKTTVTLALLAYLKKRGADVGAFKCGPDYIDPMFHRACGVASFNLDPYFLNREQLIAHFCAHKREVNIIEGVMGFNDGIAGTNKGSTATVSEWLSVPAVYAEDLLPFDERLKIPSRHLGLTTNYSLDLEAFEKAGEYIFAHCDSQRRGILLPLCGES